MKKFVFLAVIILVSLAAMAQSTIPLRADTVKITKTGGNAELVLENGTRSITGGYLRNRFNGRTEFHNVIDSAYLNAIGDTIIFRYGTTTIRLPHGTGGSSAPLTAAPLDTVWKLQVYDPVAHTTRYFPTWELFENASNQYNYFANVGTGDTLVVQPADSVLGVKSLIAGTNITFDVTDSTITINSSGGGGPGTESDPVFTASDAFAITASDISNWNTDDNTTYSGADFIQNQSAVAQWANAYLARTFRVDGVTTLDSVIVNSPGAWAFQRLTYLDANNQLQAANIQPFEIVLNTSTYNDPSWLTGLAYTKITGVTGNSKYVGTNGSGTFGVYDLPSGSGGLADAYASMTDGTTTSTASGSTTFKFRSANNRISVAVTNNDATHGDNLLITLNEGNIDLANTTGSIANARVTGLSTVATSGAYTDLSGRPTLATVATSGSYNDLSSKPTIPATINDLTDVTISSVANTQLLRYNSSSSQWENWTSNFITGNQTITLSGDVSGSGNTAITTTIGANTVGLGDIQQITTARFLGRTTASTGDVEQLTGTQATAMLDVFTSALKGLVPASSGGTTNFLRADGTWTTPAGAGTVTSFSAGDLSPLFTTSEATTTTTPALTFSLNTQTANTIFAGPTSGGVTAPTFRALVDADIPSGITMSKLNWTGSTSQYVRGDGSLATFPTSNSSFTNAAGYITNSNPWLDFAQNTPGTNPEAGFTRFFSSGNTFINWKGSDGFILTLGGTPTANRSYTLPDVGGTIGITTATQTLTNKTISYTAGTASVAPITLASGTNLTAATAGSFEYDGKALYFTPVGTERGVNSTEQVQVTTGNNLNSATGNQVVFSQVGTSDAVGVTGSTTYLFDGYINLSLGTTTTRTINFNFGGTATATAVLIEVTSSSAAAGTQAASTHVSFTALTGGTINATNTSASTRIHVNGMIRVNAGGTLIPQVAFSAAPGGTNTVTNGSYFRIWPVGSSSMQVVGNWQ